MMMYLFVCKMKRSCLKRLVVFITRKHIIARQYFLIATVIIPLKKHFLFCVLMHTTPFSRANNFSPLPLAQPNKFLCLNENFEIFQTSYHAVLETLCLNKNIPFEPINFQSHLPSRPNKFTNPPSIRPNKISQNAVQKSYILVKKIWKFVSL